MLEKEKYKLFLLVIKAIPILLALIFFLNTFLSYFDIEIKAFNYIACIGFLPLIVLYAQSYILHFCEYHRIFLHYIVVVNSVNLYDEYIRIPVDDITMFKIYNIITIISLFLVLYFKKIKQ